MNQYIVYEWAVKEKWLDDMGGGFAFSSESI